MREALGIADHPVNIHVMTRWELMGVVASKLRVGRTFILGDAAHRHPPTGGLGLTSATQDVHNLCWKVAAVLKGAATDGLLDTYEPERRSSVQVNVDNSIASALNHFMIGETLGLSDPDLTADEGWARVSRLWSGQSDDDAFRLHVCEAIASQSMEFRKLNVEYGYTYDSAAVVPDGTPPEQSLDPVRIYRPSTRPGSPLPHAWLEVVGGERRSTIDLVRPDRFLLIAGEAGGPWIDAASDLAAVNGLPVDAVRIGHLDGDYLDPQCRWLTVRGLASSRACRRPARRAGPGLRTGTLPRSPWMTDPWPNPGSAGGGMMISMERETLEDRLGREAFISLFLASNQFDEQVEQVCRAEGISHPQYAVLWVLCLADAPGGLPMGALADGLLTRSADATRLVDRLLVAGHVTREPSPGDRRVVLVSPTEQGLRLFDRLTAEIRALHRRQWGLLDKDELRELIRLLNKARFSGKPGNPPT